MQEMWVQSLCGEDPLEKEMANHSSILAWEISMDRGEQGSMGLQRVQHDWAIKLQQWGLLLVTAEDTGSSHVRPRSWCPIYLQDLDQNSRALRDAGRVQTPQVIWACSQEGDHRSWLLSVSLRSAPSAAMTVSHGYYQRHRRPLPSPLWYGSTKSNVLHCYIMLLPH